jgi:hypothetical protein
MPWQGRFGPIAETSRRHFLLFLALAFFDGFFSGSTPKAVDS